MKRVKLPPTPDTAPIRKTQYGRVVKQVGKYQLSGYRDVRCNLCGTNIPFFVGDLRWPTCSSCRELPRSTAGNTRPSEPQGSRQYNGGPSR